MVRRVPVPESVASLSLLDRVDYEDAFEAETKDTRTPEEWVRLGLDLAPPGLLPGVRLIQRALGLRLRPEAPQNPLGWSILRSDPEFFVLGADGDGGSGRVIGSVTRGRVVLSTQTRFRLRSRALWVFAAPAHRAVARLLIGRAERAVGEPRGRGVNP
jgi:hypothetical protein